MNITIFIILMTVGIELTLAQDINIPWATLLVAPVS